MEEKSGTPGKKALEEKKNPFLCSFLLLQMPRGESQLRELFSMESYIESTTNMHISRPLLFLAALGRVANFPLLLTDSHDSE